MFRTSTLYIKIKTNAFEIRSIQTGENVSIFAEEPFTTERLLIGQFHAATAALKKGINSNLGNGFLPVKFDAVIHPMEKSEGGLSEVEERIYLEVAAGAGARKSLVWVGHGLSDQEVAEKLQNA